MSRSACKESMPQPCQEMSQPLLMKKLFLKLALWVPDHQDCRNQSDVWLLAFRAKVSHGRTLKAFQAPPPPATCFFTLQYLHVFVHSCSLLLPAKGKLRKEPWSRVSKTSLVHHRRSSCSSRFQKEAGDLWSCYSGFHHYVLYIFMSTSILSQ